MVKKTLFQGGLLQMGFCNSGEKLSLTLTPRAKLGFITKQQGAGWMSVGGKHPLSLVKKEHQESGGFCLN